MEIARSFCFSFSFLGFLSLFSLFKKTSGGGNNNNSNYNNNNKICLQIFYDLVRQINRKTPVPGKARKKSSCQLL